MLPVRPGERGIPPGEWTFLPRLDGTAIPAKVRTSDDALLTAYLPAPITEATLLPAALRDELLGVAAAAAGALGLPVIDMEWAITPDGAVHVLQARPLAAMPAAGCAPDATPGGGAWKGLPSAPGRASGPVSHLCPGAGTGFTGAVLVCGNIGPDAIPALLDRPAAILATTGGPLSHAAIVARELGIPCVTAMPKAIRAIPAGTILHVDGLAGTATQPRTRDIAKGCS